METRIDLGPIHPPPAFLNFLRGMETLRVRLGPAGRVPFLNFLRGMETPEHPQTPEVRTALPKLP